MRQESIPKSSEIWFKTDLKEVAAAEAGIARAAALETEGQQKSTTGADLQRDAMDMERGDQTAGDIQRNAMEISVQGKLLWATYLQRNAVEVFVSQSGK